VQQDPPFVEGAGVCGGVGDEEGDGGGGRVRGGGGGGVGEEGEGRLRRECEGVGGWRRLEKEDDPLVGGVEGGSGEGEAGEDGGRVPPPACWRRGRSRRGRRGVWEWRK
jgi:hypothetical protein